MSAWVYVFLGGGAGSVLRFAVARWAAAFHPVFPAATFIANVLSCLLLGYLTGLVFKNALQDEARLLFMTGLCGGFSTFSTFSSEVLQLLTRGELAWAAVYVVGSLIVCVLCIYVGIQLAR